MLGYTDIDMTAESSMRTCMLALCLAALAVPAGADTLTGSKARKALYPSGKAEVVLLPEANLPPAVATALQQVGAAQPYYGAFAISPDDGALTEATSLAVNFHDVRAAAAFAVADCNKKKKGKADCIVAAVIQPKGWKDKGFQLSSQATEGFRDGYPKKNGAFAISPATGGWGVGTGAEAAIADCSARNPEVTDCNVVIQN